MPVIETHHLTRRFNALTATDDLNIEVVAGEVLAFLGPNGAGKTTTIRMLAGIIAPTSGEAIVTGIPVTKEPEKIHEVIGLLTESPGFYNRLSARRNLEFYAGFYTSLDVTAQVTKYLKLMGLEERQDDKVGNYSKGMRQRLALARALLHEPKVLFLDEPTSGLDPEGAHEVRDIIAQLRREGRTIFLSTHNLAEAEELADRIAIFQNKLLILDTVERLRRRMFLPQITIILSSAPDTLVETIRRLPYIRQVYRQGNQLTLDLINNDAHRPELVKDIVAAGANILTVNETRHSLEEIYLSLIREEKHVGP